MIVGLHALIVEYKSVRHKAIIIPCPVNHLPKGFLSANFEVSTPNGHAGRAFVRVRFYIIDCNNKGSLNFLLRVQDFSDPMHPQILSKSRLKPVHLGTCQVFTISKSLDYEMSVCNYLCTNILMFTVFFL